MSRDLLRFFLCGGDAFRLLASNFLLLSPKESQRKGDPYGAGRCATSLRCLPRRPDAELAHYVRSDIRAGQLPTRLRFSASTMGKAACFDLLLVYEVPIRARSDYSTRTKLVTLWCLGAG